VFGEFQTGRFAWLVAALGALPGVMGGAEPTNVLSVAQPASPSPPGPSEAVRQELTADYAVERLSYIKRATDQIGRKVKGRDSNAIGNLEDIALDLSAGKILLALVSSGSGSLATVVPSLAFNLTASKEARIDVDKKVFSKAPQFLKAKWLKEIYNGELAKVFQHFGREFSEREFKRAELASGMDLIGMRLTSENKEPLGVLEDLMVDLPAGRVVFLIVKPAGGPELERYLYVLPPSAVHVDTKGKCLVLRASPDTFAKGPHFERQYWVDATSPELAASVYQYYTPATVDSVGLGADGRLAVRARADSSAARLSDLAIKKAVLAEIVGDPLVRLSSSDSLSITTVKGRLTLTGQVKNQKQRQVIGAAAERAVGAGNVDNQLETRLK
jgi:sporulation protein YlmC with PRC-barrel domain